MWSIITGNLSSIGAMLSDSFSGTRKTKKGMLLVQCVSQIFYMASALILKGYSGAVQNAVAIFRNLFAAYDKESKVLTYFLIVLPVVLGVYFNNRGILGLLPVVANLWYSVSIFIFADSPRKLKYAFVSVNLAFMVFNFVIQNYVGTVANIVTAVTTFIALIKK